MRDRDSPRHRAYQFIRRLVDGARERGYPKGVVRELELHADRARWGNPKSALRKAAKAFSLAAAEASRTQDPPNSQEEASDGCKS